MNKTCIKIITSVKSWLLSVKLNFIRFFKKTPSWLNITSSTLTALTPVIEEIVELLKGKNAVVKADDIIVEIKKDLTDAIKLTSELTEDSTILAKLETIVSNLSMLLDACHISKPNNLEQIEKYITFTISEITMLINAYSVMKK
jgi:hypothetical protein